MTSQLIALRLERAAQRLGERLAALEDRLSDDGGLWREYAEVAAALAAVLVGIAPGRRGELLTTQQMAEKLGIAPKTLLRQKAKGLVQPALQLGRRGRAALRWRW
jgi:hypothetical protein